MTPASTGVVRGERRRGPIVRETALPVEYHGAAAYTAQETAMRFTRNIGMLLLAIWLILTGLMGLLGLSIPSSALVMGLLALVAGIAILLGR